MVVCVCVCVDVVTSFPDVIGHGRLLGRGGTERGGWYLKCQGRRGNYFASNGLMKEHSML